MTVYELRKRQAIDAGTCIYPGCPTPPAEDANECARHWADSKRRKARSARGRRNAQRKQLRLEVVL